MIRPVPPPPPPVHGPRGVIGPYQVWGGPHHPARLSPPPCFLTSIGYFATWNDDKLALVPSDPASPLDLERERRLLDDVRAYVGQRDYLLDAVAGKPLPAVGAPIELPADRMGYALGDQCTVSHATARLLEVKRTSAVFEEVLAFHAVDRATPYAVTALMLVEVSLATGHRTKQTTYATLAWAGMSFELQDVVRYRYFTKRK